MRIAFEVRSICISFHRSRQSTVRAFALTGDDQIPDTADKPVGVNRRSSLHLTHLLAKDFDGVIHWARDTETFQSILKSYRAARSGRQGKRLAQFRNCDTLST
jgi:hypothetical protein